ncbi:hypothetical protein GQ457_03G017500 [Hibiscus cannabinus]
MSSELKSYSKSNNELGIAYNLPRSETFEGSPDILFSSKVGNNQRTTLHFNNILEVIGCPTSQRLLNIHPSLQFLSILF